MKFKTFQPRQLETQTRFLSLHLPRGRVWNTKTGKELYKLVMVMAKGLSQLWNTICEILKEFRIDYSENYLYLWEDSLGLSSDGLTLAQRRDAVKEQLRKIPIVTDEEWETNLSDALGKTITVIQADGFTPDSDMILPNPVPTPLYAPFPDLYPMNRFIVLIDGADDADDVAQIREIVDKYKFSATYVIIINRGMYS